MATLNDLKKDASFQMSSSFIEGDAPTGPGSFDEEIVAPGKSADFSYGISYEGPWTKNTAEGRLARSNILALALHSIPLRIVDPYLSNQLFRDYPSFCDKFSCFENTSIEKTLISIKQVGKSQVDALETLLLPPSTKFLPDEVKEAILKANVVYLTCFPTDNSVDLLKKVACVWTCSSFILEKCRYLGIDNVSMVPYCYDPERFKKVYPWVNDTSYPSGKRFYSLNVRTPFYILSEFLQTFSPSDTASLFLSLNEHQDIPALYKKALALDTVQKNGWGDKSLRSRVRIVEGPLSEDDTDKIHLLNNIYVKQIVEDFDIESLIGESLNGYLFGNGEAFSHNLSRVKFPYSERIFPKCAHTLHGPTSVGSVMKEKLRLLLHSSELGSHILDSGFGV